VVDSSIVWGDIVGVEEEAFLHWKLISKTTRCKLGINLHLLKLLTGVEISTRPVKRSGRPGKDVNRSKRTAAAAPKRAAFRLSICMLYNTQ
jgi:hypothetical protein